MLSELRLINNAIRIGVRSISIEKPNCIQREYLIRVIRRRDVYKSMLKSVELCPELRPEYPVNDFQSLLSSVEQEIEIANDIISHCPCGEKGFSGCRAKICPPTLDELFERASSTNDN